MTKEKAKMPSEINRFSSCDRDENGSLDSSCNKHSDLYGVNIRRTPGLDIEVGSKKDGKIKRGIKEYPVLPSDKIREGDRRSLRDDQRREEGTNQGKRTTIFTSQRNNRENFGPGYYHIQPKERLHADICNEQGIRESGADQVEAGEEPVSGIRTLREEFDYFSELPRQYREEDEDDISQVIQIISEFAPERAKAIRTKRDRSKVLAKANTALEKLFKKLGLIAL